MKKLHLLLSALILTFVFSNCTKNDGDKEKMVEMTIYSETGYGGALMSDVWTEPLVFSDTDDPKKQTLTDIIVEDFDFDYQRGYEYKFKVKKVWMQNPPQDVSAIKYVFIQLLSKTKIITADSEKNMQLIVSPETVKFTPKYPYELDNDGRPRIYDALRVREVNTNNWLALKEIERFDFESGFTYSLNVKKVTKANPYSVKYVLIDILSKEKEN